MSLKWVFLCIFTSSIILLAGKSRADDAIDLYKRGIELFNLEKYEEAADTFREAYAAKPSWKLFFNIGQAEAAARRYGLALDAFEAYLVEGGDDVPADRKSEVLSDIQAFKMLVGTVEIKAPEGTEIFVDSKKRGSVPLDGVLRVAAGAHRFTLKQGDRLLFDKDVKIAGGVDTLIEAADEKGSKPSVPEGATASEGASSSNKPDSRLSKKAVAGIAVGVAGLATAAVGAVFIVKAQKSFATAEEQEDLDEYDKWRNEYKRENIIGISLAAVGGAMTAAGIVLIVLGLSGEEPASKEDGVSLYFNSGGLQVSF